MALVLVFARTKALKLEIQYAPRNTSKNCRLVRRQWYPAAPRYYYYYHYYYCWERITTKTGRLVVVFVVVDHLFFPLRTFPRLKGKGTVRGKETAAACRRARPSSGCCKGCCS